MTAAVRKAYPASLVEDALRRGGGLLYRDGLSAGSLATLKKQGGLMSDAELAVFESSSFAAAAVRVRRWDDGERLWEWRPELWAISWN